MTTNLIKSVFQSTTTKIIMVGFLSLFLLIPLEFVKDLINERSMRKREVVDEVAKLWGQEVKFYGPILKIPYNNVIETTSIDEFTKKATIQKRSVVNYAYFFPERLNNISKIDKNTSLKRGIYNNVVFSVDMKFDGFFGTPNFDKLEISPSDILWEKATVVILTSNLKSIQTELTIDLNRNIFGFEAKQTEDIKPEASNNLQIVDKQAEVEYGTLQTNTFDYKAITAINPIHFKFNIKYNGSKAIKFVPVGKSTFVALDSNWDSPSFEGAFAANNHTKKISKDGFHADWQITNINRPFPQQYLQNLPDLDRYNFGVKLLEPVDQYQQNERASKYGFLVIGLTFLIFFIIQTISKVHIHIFQYTMIGLSLVMFYTLLISITEHSSFAFAYAIAALAVLLLIGLYAFSILKNKKFPILITISLAVLYCFIFIIIQLENYALLVGSIGLFAILASLMYFSRQIDWNN